jgi:hypothetical protein
MVRLNVTTQRRVKMVTIDRGAVRNRRKAWATKIWNDDIHKIVAIFQETFHAGEVIMDPAKYVTEYKENLEAAGPELTFLQLATPDTKSPFGWKPTARLMKLVANRKTLEKAKRLYEADIWYQLLDDYVFGYKSSRDQGSVFTRELLLALGLICEEADGDWVTEDLHILFGNAYFTKREQDGLPLSPEISPGPYRVVLQPRS